MASQPLKRNLYAILAADVAGYSRIMGENEEEAFRILKAHRAITDSIIELHAGRVFNTAGDSVLAAFESPVEAVRAAIEIQDAIKTRNLALPENRRLTFRIGINLGDVIVKDNDLLGDAVNVAARLESQAAPGGLCISGTVYDQIVGKLDLRFETAGELSLKNIQRPVRAYMFGGGTAPPIPALAASVPQPAAKRSSFALLAGIGAAGVLVLAGIVYSFLRENPQTTASVAAPASVAASTAPTAVPRSRFDGVWSGSWCPRAFTDREAFCVARVLRVTNGQIEMESGKPGVPGYTKLSGAIAADGTLEMSGNGVGGQGGSKGLPFSVDLRGRIDGEIMTTSGKFQNGREIEFNLTRTQR
jgi:class 3 adenylate cyclase